MEKKLKILLATDYSSIVTNAEVYAVRFAQNTNATITLLHVYEFPLIPTPVNPVEYAKTIIDYDRTELKRLKQHKNELLRALNIKNSELINERLVREGNVGKQIGKAANDIEADFIVIGTHGLTGVQKILGTHAWSVIKKSSIPVLAIPKGAVFKEIKKIVFATEYREGEMPAINFLTRLASRFDAEVTIVHVTNYVLTKNFEREMFEKYRRDVKSKNTYEKLEIHLAYSEDIVAGLDDFCSRTKADWLVMSTKKPILIEELFIPGTSMTQKMSVRTRTPFLSIPDFYNPKHANLWKYSEHEDFRNPIVV